MKETFEILERSCPNCQGKTKYHWVHADDGGLVQISNYNKLKCLKCENVCDMKHDKYKFGCKDCYSATTPVGDILLLGAIILAAEFGSFLAIPLGLAFGLNNSRKGPFLLLADNIKIEYSELKLERFLDPGSFKDCYEGKVKGKKYNDQEKVAIGEIQIPDNCKEEKKKKIKEDFWKEVDILRNLCHPNIVGFVGACISSKKLYIITELCGNGNLYKYMQKVPKPSHKQQIQFMYDIALGVAHLHEQRPSIIHRDLKSPNILISSDLRAKVNDFGLVRLNPDEFCKEYSKHIVGTIRWRAPETLPKPSYTGKSDVYACGLIFWEIMTWGKEGIPFEYVPDSQLDKEVRIKGRRPLMDKLSAYNSNLLKLIEEMWDGNPSNRPSMTNVSYTLPGFLHQAD